MKQWMKFLAIMVMVTGCLLWTGTEVSWAKEKRHDSINPGSILYPIDRLGESLKETFLSDEKKVDFYFNLSLERFDEARFMYLADDSDQAYELFKEGLGNVGKALQAWKRCLKKDIEVENLKADFKIVLEDGKETFHQLKKDLNLGKVAELTKELAQLAKEQVELILNMDNK